MKPYGITLRAQTFVCCPCRALLGAQSICLPYVSRSRDMVEWMCYQPLPNSRSGICILHQNPRTLNTASNAARCFLQSVSVSVTRRAIVHGGRLTIGSAQPLYVSIVVSPSSQRPAIARGSARVIARMRISKCMEDQIGASHRNKQNHGRRARYADSRLVASAQRRAPSNAALNTNVGNRESIRPARKLLSQGRVRNAERYSRLSTETSEDTIAAASVFERQAGARVKSTLGHSMMLRARDCGPCMVNTGAQCTSLLTGGASSSAINGHASYVDAKSS